MLVHASTVEQLVHEKYCVHITYCDRLTDSVISHLSMMINLVNHIVVVRVANVGDVLLT